MADVIPEDAAKLEELMILAGGKLRQIFRKSEFDSKDLAMGRLAATTLSAYSRIKQADGARISTNVMLARELAQSPEELSNYIRLTMPNHPLSKALPAGNGKPD